MPEVFRKYGCVFFFYANEGSEPMHIHVRKAGGYVELIKRKWNEVHGS